jgi:hypothetical protein
MIPPPMEPDVDTPPPWWSGPLITLGFVIALIMAIYFATF